MTALRYLVMPSMGDAMSFMKKIDSIEDLQGIIDVIPNPVFVKSRDHRIVLLNASACDLFGHEREVILASSDFDLFPFEEVQAFCEADDRVFNTGEIDETEETVTDASGVVRIVVTRKQRITLGGEDFLVGVATDLTAYREAEAHNRYLAFHDTLTGLPNRALLNERIDRALSEGGSRGACALIYIDLDRFKEVNDTFGHPTGDQLLRQFAARLSGIVRATDTVARLGGDEFAILLQDALGGPNDSHVDICNRIIAAAILPFPFETGTAHINASVGLAEIWDGAMPTPLSRQELHRRADMALYQAKAEGRGCYRTFTDALDQRLRERRLLEFELRHALASGRGLKVEYQPLFETCGSRVLAVEALVRWDHPRLGFLQPADFLDVAEESGLILPLGDWVLERACVALSGRPDVALAINISPTQLASEHLVERVLSIIERTGFDVTRLQLEVTEHTILDLRLSTEKLKELRAAGMKIVLDDFGTGYSSLSHLHKLEIDKVKIDRSFVQDLGRMQGSDAIVRAVATLGRALGLVVTAEGVETEQQRACLRALGCEELQGYLLSRPLPEEEALAFLDHLTSEPRVA